MGYSCTANASLTLEGIMNQRSDTSSSNTWEHENGFVYFYDVGRENRDGAITGSVWKVLKNGNAKPSGNFRIEPDGSVTRFPCLTKAMRKYANQQKSDF